MKTTSIALRGIRKSKAQLTLPERIVSAQTKVAQSMDVFKSAKQEVGVAQVELRDVIKEAQAEVDKYNAIIADATAELEYHAKLEAKLSEFTA